MILPSIDIMDGKAVQLVGGKKKVLERDDVCGLASEFAKFGEVAVVDLDAALGRGDNSELIAKICKIADCRVGGGIRSVEKAERLLGAGAKKIIVGTKARAEFLLKLPKERVIVAVDAKEGYVVCEGWRKKTGKSPIEVARELEDYCSEFLFTNVDKEGLMQGCDFGIVREILGVTQNKLTVAGGITSFEDIKVLEDMGVNSQVGMALYTGRIKLSDAFVSLLDFGKDCGLVPTVVQDERGQVLMLAYSSKESLSKTFECGRATYYSRSRKRLWTKGESSGNFQEIVKVRYDCDRDTLLFTVRQKNGACHTGNYSCFGCGDKEFFLDDVYDVVVERVRNPIEGSYTSGISCDEDSIKEKIREESYEVLNYTDRDNLVWEIADLAYFVMVLMAKKGITPGDVRNELWRRRR